MLVTIFSDEYFMNEAMKEAQLSFDAGEVPIGAIIVCNNRIIAKAHNMTEKLTDVTAHAEMLVFTSASNFIGGKYLTECTLYVTLEPCVMCAGASYWTQISKIVYGAQDKKKGFSLVAHPLLHPKTQVVSGVMQKECANILHRFFAAKR